MRLRNLFEAFGEEVAIIFGRFNPPHKGHRAAWELASKSPIWYVGTNESTVGPKDPLPYDVKVEAMKTVWPEVEGHIVPETSWLTLASKVYEKNPNATLLCLTDEDWVTKTIVQYNGKEGAHGFYNFKKIEQKPTPRLSSATALRDAVTKGDRDAFTQAAGVDADTPVAGKSFFDLVAEYLLPYSNAPKKVAKKKVAESLEEAYIHDKFKFYHEGEMIGLIVPHTNGGAKTYRKFGPGRQQKVKLHDTEEEAKKWLIEKWKEQGVAEVSKSTLDRYVTKAVDAHGHADFAARQSKNDPSKRSYHVDQKKTAEKRRQGISRALDRMSKEGVAEGEKEIDIDWHYKNIMNTKGLSDKAKKDTTDIYNKLKKDKNKKGVAEGEADYGADYQDKVKRLGQMAKQGERKTVWDPVKRVYKTVPVNAPKKESVEENFADGKNPGRKGLAKRSGVNTKASVSDLRKTAKNSSGEKQRMAHWLANMKAGKAKNEEAAGVGIITKQNSTVDVNKGTPRKNLKAFRLVK
jgi:hypothetical protein